MKKSNRFTLTSIFAIFILCFNLMHVQPAMADESAPTDPAPAADVTDVPAADQAPAGGSADAPAVEPPAQAAEPATNVDVPTEEPVAPPVVSDEIPPIDGAAATGPSSVAETLAALPEDVSLVVLGASGESLPLVTTEAAQILAIPDPQFCPTGSLPGDAACGAIRTTIQAAVDDAKAAGKAGTVFIQSGTYAEDVTIADFINALILQGVLSLSPYVVLTNPADRPIINGRIFIQDGNDTGSVGNTANITLADLVINDANTANGD
ncbi:MAG: hypothetical protein NT121_22940, partial [Chloroflexi bacterium]|nr:hypothetical protein [Chloroflexota bacterium]